MGQKLRNGFTTGSCAAAAAKAATYMLFSGNPKNSIEIQTPSGQVYHAQVEKIRIAENQVSCGVYKDGGDDPDITTGLLICATVKKNEGKNSPKDRSIQLKGGSGVGKVTMPGLDQPVGEAAINRVPRQMILSEVEELCRLFDYTGSLTIEISIPGGAELAAKTFNPKLGITGGLSILGTSGIVEPMSTAALIETIHLELHQRALLGHKMVAITPGNYGRDFMKETYGYELDQSVKCSNFIGKALDIAREEGFEQILLTGHIGKLIKLSGGIMNTHSREGDCRMELMVASALRCGADIEILKGILSCVSTSAAISLLQKENLVEAVSADLLEHILQNLSRRVENTVVVECIIFENQYGLLAESTGAGRLLHQLLQ